MTKEEIEADKIRKMRELLNKGDAQMPKRTVTKVINSTNSQKPTVATATMQAAGLVTYGEKPTKAMSVSSHVIPDNAITIDVDRKPENSTPAPV